MSEQFYTLCPKCGKMIRAGVKFCAHCGERFASAEEQKRVCPNCGKEAPEGEKFCSDCGAAYTTGSAVTSARSVPKAAPIRTVKQPQAASEGMSRNDFYEAYAKPSTKSWAKWLPILGVFSAIVYLVFFFIRIAWHDTVGAVFILFDVLIVGGSSVMMMREKKTVYYTALMVYNIIASVLAFIDFDFSNILWLAASIYVVYKMVKIDRAYRDYTLTGVTPGELI